MEENKTLFNVIKTEAEKIEIIINNTILMLSNRIFIDKNGSKQQLLNYSEAKNKIVDNPAKAKASFWSLCPNKAKPVIPEITRNMYIPVR